MVNRTLCPDLGSTLLLGSQSKVLFFVFFFFTSEDNILVHIMCLVNLYNHFSPTRAGKQVCVGSEIPLVDPFQCSSFAFLWKRWPFNYFSPKPYKN